MKKTSITTCKNNFKSNVEAETVEIFGLDGKRILLAFCDKDGNITSYAILTDEDQDRLRKIMIYCSHDEEDVLKNKEEIERRL